jgi:large subunit ribosomal protein L22
MQARALKRYIPSSPLKMKIVIDQIRGKNAAEALIILRFTPKHAAKVAEQTLRSAISNLNNKAEQAEMTINDDEVFVKEVYVNQGPSMRRVLPAPMGRAYRIKKRSNHLTIVVATPEIVADEVALSDNKDTN